MGHMTLTQDGIRAMIDCVREIGGVIDDGSDGIGIIVRQALADDPTATAAQIARIVIEAQESAEAERETRNAAVAALHLDDVPSWRRP